MTIPEASQSTATPSTATTSTTNSDAPVNRVVQEPTKWLAAYLYEEDLASDQVSMVYIDLKSGKRYSYNSDTVYVAASTIKVPMAMYTYDRVQAGDVRLDLQLRYSEMSDYEEGAGSLQFTIVDGDTYLLGELIELAIRESDNIATNMIFRYWRERPEGISLSTRMNQAYGLNYDSVASINADEMATVLERLYRNPDENPYYEHLIELMKQTSFDEYATKLLPDGIYAHKYGLFHGTTERGTFFQLLGDAFGNELRIGVNVFHFFNIDEKVFTKLLRQFLL